MSEHTIMRAGEAPDYTGEAPGAFIGYGRPMGSEQLGFNMRILEPGMSHAPPGEDPSWGHGHQSIEEIYFVVSGELTVKLDDEVTKLGPRDAVLIPPQTTRGARNDSDEPVAFVMCSVKAEDPMAETRPQEDFWPDAG